MIMINYLLVKKIVNYMSMQSRAPLAQKYQSVKPPRFVRDGSRMRKKTSNSNILSETVSFTDVSILEPSDDENIMMNYCKGSSGTRNSCSGKSIRDKSCPSMIKKPEKAVSQFQCVQYETCLLHGKPADLICLKDKMVVCCNCALFGEHRGHQVINIQGLLSKIANYTESCLEIYQQLKNKESETNEESIRESLENCLLEKKAQDKKKVEEEYKSLAAILKLSQKKALMKIDTFYKQKLESFEKVADLEDIRNKMETWFTEIDKLGSFISNINNIQTYIEAIKYVDESGYGNNLMLEGEKLLQELGSAGKIYEFKLEEEMNRNIFTFDSKVKKDLENYCMVESYGRNKKIQEESRKSCSYELSISDTSPQNINALIDFSIKPTIDDYLLASITNPIEEVEQMTQKQIKIENIPTLSISDIKVNLTNSSEECSGIIKQEQTEIIPVVPERTRRRKIEVSDKYKGTIDDLRHDRAEVIDLTGAELGDHNALALSDFVRKSKKLKVLKLVKNRLTDECLNQLLHSIKGSNVTSLNLSQNSLSDKTINILESLHPPNLRTLTITLNRITRRNVKTKVEKLASTGLNIVL